MGLEAGTYINDLNTLNPDGAADAKSQGDDHLRLIKTCLKNTFPGLSGRFRRVQVSGGAFVAAATDNTTLVRMTAASTVTLLAAATAGNGYELLVYNDSAGSVTLTPAGTEKINGASTVVIPPQHFAWVFCQNTATLEYYAVVVPLFTADVIGADITGNITLAAVDITNGTRRITATAVVTLPLLSTVVTGRKLRLKSVSTADITFIPNAANTVDGIATAVRIPSYKSYTLQANGTDWVVIEEPDDFVGDLKPVSATLAAQKGWVLADASAINRLTYAGLFAVTGTINGVGDGVNTFNVFDSRGRAVIGDGTGSGLTARTVGGILGEENHLLTIAEMPSHNHPGSTFPAQGGSSGSAGQAAQSNSGGGTPQAMTVAAQGGGASHNVMQPSAVARFMVKT